MKRDLVKKVAPYLSAVIIFLAITVVYFSPIFEGKQLRQHDIKMWKGMQKEVADFRAETGEEALWTNSMFGGMPAWQISVHYSKSFVRYFDKYITLTLPRPTDLVFLYFLGFFVLLLVLGVDVWVSIIGAIAFALSSYFFIILGAGHITKAHAIGYMAPVLAGIIWTFRGEYLKGAVLTAMALGAEIMSNHLQITYYLLILVLIYGFYELYENFKNKTMGHFFKATGILVIAAILAVGVNFTILWGTYEYGKHTMRGEPELTKEKEVKTSGLDKDYITAWSYGLGETWSLLIPDVKGGASGYIGNIPAVKKADPAYQKVIAQQNSYWGDQPMTSGPVYVGAIVMFFFLLGMFILKDKLKWPLLIAGILSVLLSWGKNWMPFTDLFIDYFPGYNKFRTVSMILVVAELIIPVIAFMAVNAIVKNPGIISKKINLKFVSVSAFYLSLILTAGVTFLFWLTPTTFFNFFSQFELQQFNQLKQSNNPAQITTFMNNLESVRIAIFKADAIRSFLFIAGAGVMVWLYSAKKVNKAIFLLVLGVMILADLYPVNKRYLNDDNYVRKSKMEVPFQKTAADNYILKDTDPDFRVLDVTKNVFNDASTSYFHKSIGGYHGAKLQRYQDLIDYHLNKEIDQVRNVFKNQSAGMIDKVLSQQQVLNMLNTKYVIYNPAANPLLNRFAYGNAWFVNSVKWVENADEEIDALDENDLKTTAIIDKRFKDKVEKEHFSVGSSDVIKLTSYAPNHLVYDFKSTNDQMVVFSEVYYDDGWTAYVDGEEFPIVRANYILRAMMVPAGNHKIEFKYNPKEWVIGEKIAIISTLILMLGVIAGIVIAIQQARRKKAETEQ